MKVGYYPGCSLESTSQEYDWSIKEVCSKLQIQLSEIKDWNCCGATSAHCIDEKAAFLLSARNLEIAEEEGLDLAIPCSGCFNRLKFAEKNALNNPRFEGMSTYKGSIRVMDMLSVFSDETILEKLESMVVKPLNGLKVATYYGCMSLRPPKITDIKNCENPDSMENIMKAIGADIIDWSFRTVCCGGSLSLSRIDISTKMMFRIFDMADEAEIDCLVTSCPLCQTNLDTRMKDISKAYSRNFNIPILYFSELMGFAMGSKKAKGWFKKHLVNPMKILKKRGLM